MARTHEANTLAEIFATENETYVKIIAGFTVPVVRKFAEGHVCSATEAQALSNYFVDRAASVANSNIERGSWSKKTDEEKTTLARDYLIGAGEKPYAFSDDIGSDVFGMSLLRKGATRVVAAMAGDKVAGMTESEIAKAVEPSVTKMLHSPEFTEKYQDKVRAAMEAILAERHEKRTRSAKAEGGLTVEL